MDCERFDKATMDLLYGELDELSEAAALRHLHHCTRCRDIWGHLRTTRELAEIPLDDPPAGLFESILDAEEQAHRSLPARERFSRAISVMAGYAMRPQLAMAALLLLMIGSSLVFVRNGPLGHGEVSVTEVGKPYAEPMMDRSAEETLVFEGTEERRAEHIEKRLSKESAEVGSVSEPGNVSHVASSRETYSAAMSAYQEGRYAEAERLFSEVASAGGEQAASAALHEGHAARNGSGCQRAASLYDAVAEQYSSSTVADEASWLAASCYRAMGQVRRAAAHYEALTMRPAFAVRAQKALEEINAQLIATSEKENADKGETAAASPPSKASAGAKPSASSSKLSDPAAESKGTKEAVPESPPVAAPNEAPQTSPKDSN
jgi:hypothetical protein